MAKKQTDELPDFEQSIERLEEILDLTESPDTKLEDVITLVEEGTRLIKHCRHIVKQAELRIESLENPGEATANQPSDIPSQTNDNDHGTFSLN